MKIIEAALRPVIALAAAVWQRIQDEPVYTQAVVVASIAVATAFGLAWGPEQVGAVTAFSAMALAWLTRKSVTPTAHLVAAADGSFEPCPLCNGSGVSHQ